MKDLQASERFIRIVGERGRPPSGEPPTAEARGALGKMAQYRTRAPKGVFVYKSHEEANGDRERWLLDAMVAKAKSACE